MEFTEAICRALKHLRKIRDKTQEEVYLGTGISVGNYEAQKRHPTIDNINSLCEYYGFETGTIIELANTSLKTGISIEKLVDDIIAARSGKW